jgi:hypothetical protein
VCPPEPLANRVMTWRTLILPGIGERGTPVVGTVIDAVVSHASECSSTTIERFRLPRWRLSGETRERMRPGGRPVPKSVQHPGIVEESCRLESRVHSELG